MKISDLIVGQDYIINWPGSGAETNTYLGPNDQEGLDWHNFRDDEDSEFTLTEREIIQWITPVEVEDLVNHPKHYNSHPSGVECITITQHMNFCQGNAVKYIWRAGLKSENAIQDLEKAEFYIKCEIARLKGLSDK